MPLQALPDNRTYENDVCQDLRLCRFIYNKMLVTALTIIETGQKLNNTPAQYKEEFPWLKEVDSLALAITQNEPE